jgi:hypothetical protein
VAESQLDESVTDHLLAPVASHPEEAGCRLVALASEHCHRPRNQEASHPERLDDLDSLGSAKCLEEGHLERLGEKDTQDQAKCLEEGHPER